MEYEHDWQGNYEYSDILVFMLSTRFCISSVLSNNKKFFKNPCTLKK